MKKIRERMPFCIVILIMITGFAGLLSFLIPGGNFFELFLELLITSSAGVLIIIGIFISGAIIIFGTIGVCLFFGEKDDEREKEKLNCRKAK